mgnify:CR=1 FL=1
MATTQSTPLLCQRYHSSRRRPCTAFWHAEPFPHPRPHQPTRTQVVVGSSTSQLALNLSCLFSEASFMGPGDNVVMQQASHESIIGPWVRMAARVPQPAGGDGSSSAGGGSGGGGGCQVRWWGADPASGGSCAKQLEGLLDGRTRLVVLTHVSNLLGGWLGWAGGGSLGVERVELYVGRKCRGCTGVHVALSAHFVKSCTARAVHLSTCRRHS